MAVHWLHQKNSLLGSFPDGPWVDARPYHHLKSAISAIGAREVTLLISLPMHLGLSTLVIPSSIALKFLRGGRIVLKDGETLVINGPVEAGPWQIFSGDGTIGGSPVCDHLYPQWFGVIGDGCADDSEALQKAFHACAATRKTLYFSRDLSIRVVKNLYVYGEFDIVGENTNAEIVLDGNLDCCDGYQYWINFGIPEKRRSSTASTHIGIPERRRRSTISTYTGSVSNLRFRVTENARVYRVLFFHNAERFSVSGCHFDLTAAPDATAIEGANDCNWCEEPKRKYGRFLNNTCIAAQTDVGGEGIGIANAEDMIIEGNFIYGFADDPIGCHGVRRLTITHNHCYSTTGRILFTNCTDVRAIGNYAERIASPVDGSWHGGGALMYAGLEHTGSDFAPSRIVINGNQLYLPAEVPGYTYGIRLMGIRDTTVSSNQIRCDSKWGGGGIRIERDDTLLNEARLFSVDLAFVGELDSGGFPEALRHQFEARFPDVPDWDACVLVKQAGSQWRIINNGRHYAIRREDDELNVYETTSRWIDPTALDADGVARPRDVHIIGNTCYGNYPGEISQTGDGLVGPFYVHANVASEYLWYSNTSFGLNYVVGLCLFSVDLAFVGELDVGGFPEALHDQFGAHDHFLSPDAVVEVEQAGSQWRIINNGKKYAIRWEDCALNVYMYIANPMRLRGDTLLVSSRLLFEGYCAGITAGGCVEAVRQGGTITRFYIERPTRVTYIDITLDTEIRAGEILVQFLKNGDPKGSRSMERTDGRHKRIAWSDDNDYVTCEPDDYITIQLEGSDASGTSGALEPTSGINAVLSVNGVGWL